MSAPPVNLLGRSYVASQLHWVRGSQLLARSTDAEQIGTTFSLAQLKACLAACSLALGELDTVPALC